MIVVLSRFGIELICGLIDLIMILCELIIVLMWIVVCRLLVWVISSGNCGLFVV